MKSRSLAVLLAVLVAAPLFAHGDKKHVVGTIEKLSAESITVKTKDGKSVEVKLLKTTTYLTSDDKPAAFSDLVVGQRVVVHADPQGNELLATTVKFASAEGAAKKPAA